MARFHKVAVLMGGVSNERAISLRSGQAVAKGLGEAGYEVVPVILSREAIDEIPADVEAAFIALHGHYGEDGGVQADLDRIGLPYTGSGAAASRLAMDKVLTKQRLIACGLPTPAYEVLAPGETTCNMRPPLVVKPPRDGSSLGVARVMTASDWSAALATARGIDQQVLVERYIAGREWTVGVVDDEALPVLEIRAADGWYGYDAKYVTGATQYCFPDAAQDGAALERCGGLALATFRALDARGLGRVDFRLADDGQLHILELNTIPGFTATSLLPKAAARRGMNFAQLCARILETARCDAP